MSNTDLIENNVAVCAVVLSAKQTIEEIKTQGNNHSYELRIIENHQTIIDKLLNSNNSSEVLNKFTRIHETLGELKANTDSLKEKLQDIPKIKKDVSDHKNITSKIKKELWLYRFVSVLIITMVSGAMYGIWKIITNWNEIHAFIDKVIQFFGKI